MDEHPELFQMEIGQNRASKLVHYLANVMVNGPMTPFGNKTLLPSSITPTVPPIDPSKSPPLGWRNVLQTDGPKGLAKKIREHKRLLLTDTTSRDAHQVCESSNNQSLLDDRACGLALIRCGFFIK